jgi:hypothetical protein
MTLTASGFMPATEPATRFWTARPLAAPRLAAHADGDGGGRLLGVFLEQLALGDDQVDTGGAHAVPALDGTLQLALQGALAVQLLDEVGLAQRAAGVEDFVADRARGHETLGEDQLTGGVDLVAGDIDRRAVALGLVLDAGGVERLGGGGGFLGVDVRQQQLVGLLAHHHHHGGDHGDPADHDADQGGQTADAKPLNRAEEFIQPTPYP